jgi:hypothetical protein
MGRELHQDVGDSKHGMRQGVNQIDQRLHTRSGRRESESEQ